MLMITCLIDDSHSNGYEVVSCSFDMHLLIASEVEHLFIYLLAFACLLGRGVYSGPLPLFNWIVWLFGVELYEFLMYFRY